MTRARHDIQHDRVVGAIAVDSRNALLFERMPTTGKIVVSKVGLSLSGRPTLGSARRAFGIPMHCLSELVTLLQRLDAEQPSSRRTAA